MSDDTLPDLSSTEKCGRKLSETAASSIPYLLISTQSNLTCPPKALQVEDYDGLLYYHLVSSGRKAKLIAYWKDRASLDAYGARLEAALSFPNREYEGPITDTRSPKQRFSWPSVAKTIVGAAALFGAFSAIQDYYAKILRPADIGITFADSAPVNSLASGPLKVAYTVINEDRFASAEIWSEKAQVTKTDRNAPDIELTGPPVITSRLDPGSPIASAVSGQAPPLSGHGPPEKYQVRIAVLAQEGLIWTRKPFPSDLKEVAIWRELGWSQPTVERSGNRLATFKLFVYPGRTFANVTGQITLGAPVPVTLDVTGATGQNKIPPGPAQRVSVIFATGQLQAFGDYRYFFTVDAASALEPRQWQDIANSVDVAFQTR